MIPMPLTPAAPQENLPTRTEGQTVEFIVRPQGPRVEKNCPTQGRGRESQGSYVVGERAMEQSGGSGEIKGDPEHSQDALSLRGTHRGGQRALRSHPPPSLLSWTAPPLPHPHITPHNHGQN